MLLLHIAITLLNTLICNNFITTSFQSLKKVDENHSIHDTNGEIVLYFKLVRNISHSI